jgi:hypothetical protein
MLALGVLRIAFGFVLASVAPAAADKAFCNVTPCDKREITTRKLDKDLPAGSVTCKKGHEVGEDQQKRVVYCTTAKNVTVDGMMVKAGEYTLFHPNGKIYQTRMAKPFERTLADGSKVSCGADLISQTDTGALTYCKLGGARAAKPKAKVGEGISFHPSGRIAGLHLDETFTQAGLTIPAGNSIVFDDAGRLIGGYLRDPITAGAWTIEYDFRIHPNGKLMRIGLAKAAKIAGHEFPERAELVFRDDGSLEAAQYVEKRGFMIHGEPWTDTRFMTFDKTGKVLTTRLEHYQAKEGPGQYRERLQRERKGKKP